MKAFVSGFAFLAWGSAAPEELLGLGAPVEPSLLLWLWHHAGFGGFAAFAGWFGANHLPGRVCGAETIEEGIVPIALCVLSLPPKQAWSWVFRGTPNKGQHLLQGGCGTG